MELQEGWPTEEMIQVVQDYVGTKNRLLAKTICEKVLEAAPTPPAQESGSHCLGELLAVIHRDGGHYQQEHGDYKATRDAIHRICEWKRRDNELEAPAQEDEPVAWMIDYAIEGMNRRGIFGHNPIADYRELDPNATSTPLYTRP